MLSLWCSTLKLSKLSLSLNLPNKLEFLNKNGEGFRGISDIRTDGLPTRQQIRAEREDGLPKFMGHNRDNQTLAITAGNALPVEQAWRQQ